MKTDFRRALARLRFGRLEPFGFEARLARDQVVYAAAREAFAADRDGLPVEVAGLEHLDAIVEASAAMAREEAHDDPQGRNPSLFRERIKTRVRRQFNR